MKAVIFLLLTPTWSAPVIDTDDGLKLHNHTDPNRSGKYFSNNEFVMGNVAVDGNVTGEQISIGHDLSINIDHEMDHTGVDAAIDGGWTEFSDWGACSKTCGGEVGQKVRSRTCTNPPPSFGGEDCRGQSEEVQSCVEVENCPIDGGWSEWSESSECSASCGAATRKWARTCTNPAPTNEGKSCEGNDEETRSCDRPSCELYPADNQGGLPAIVSVAFFLITRYQYYDSKISGAIEENRKREERNRKHKEVMTSLNAIKNLNLFTQKGVHALQASVDFVSEKIQLDEAHTKIQTHFDSMSELKRMNATKEQWDDWAIDVLDGNVGTRWALLVINRQIISNNVLEKFKNKATAAAVAGNLKRSVAGSVSDFFKYQVHYQIVGFQMVLEAFKQLKYCSRRDMEYKIMIERFNRQVLLFKNIDASMPPINYLQNVLDDGRFHMFDARYVHLHAQEADEGHVVTGVQLYQHNYNRIALKIKQGRLQEFGKIDSEKWKKINSSGLGPDIFWPLGPNWGREFVRIDIDCPYIDLNTAKVPDGSAIVGVSFYKKGNRLSIKVKSAIVDYRNGKVYPDKWIHAPEWGDQHYKPVDEMYEKVKEETRTVLAPCPSVAMFAFGVGAFCTDIIVTRTKTPRPTDHNDYVDMGKVETKPPSMITAAALYQKGDRMAVKVSDIFKPTAGRYVSCAPNSDVRMSTNDYKYQCCDGFPYAGEASQECPGDKSGPKYETEDIQCIN